MRGLCEWACRRVTRLPLVRPPNHFSILLALASLTVGLSAYPGSSSGTTVSAEQVTIVRDSAGIPHITARNFRALGYGEAWAFSQDNFCLLAQDFVTVEGERSQYFGP